MWALDIKVEKGRSRDSEKMAKELFPNTEYEPYVILTVNKLLWDGSSYKEITQIKGKIKTLN